MLRGRRLGFHIYAASNIVHLLATVGVMLLWIVTIYLSIVGVLLFFTASSRWASCCTSA